MLSGNDIDMPKGDVYGMSNVIKDLKRWNVCRCFGFHYDYYDKGCFLSHGRNVVEKWLVFINFFIVAYVEKL